MKANLPLSLGDGRVHGVEHDAQAVDVCSAVERLIAEDLWREVSESSVDVLLLLRLFPVVREAEVDESEVVGAIVVLEDHVLHLQVSVHDVDLFEVREGREDPPDDLEGLSVVEDQIRRLESSAELAWPESSLPPWKQSEMILMVVASSNIS